MDEDDTRISKYRYESGRIVGVNDLSAASIISQNNPNALIDSLGNLFNPLAIEVTGKWAKNRVSDLLPLY
ncbi:MAG: hypothetical protein HY800_09530 [Ignavibacteriales bacterium]|nr:hypothetical protein [Ignavibacteriales bacterium]